MSFRSAISSSLSSLDHSKLEFAVAAHNIANADDKNYSKLTVNTAPSVLAGFLAGVDVSSISTSVDQLLQSRLYVNIAQDSYNQTINDYFKEISAKLGAPGDLLTLDKNINTLFSALEDFSRNTSSVSVKTHVVDEFSKVAGSVANMALDLQNIRLEADNAINNEITSLNSLLESAYKTSKVMYNLPAGSMERVDAETTFTGVLEEISKYFDLYQYIDDVGHYKIFTREGDCLVGDIQYFLKYTPQPNLSNLINDTPLNPILTSAYNQNGFDIGMNKAVIPGASSSLTANKYNTGKIGALVAIRDNFVPQILTQLDNLAKNLKDSFNNVHNNGNGFPPPNTLTSTNLMTHDQILGFTGKTRFAVVDDNGLPITNIPALTLDLSKLDTGGGAGKPNVQGIVQEIQYHFGSKLVTDKSISLSNLSDIKLASLTKNIAPSSNFVLDLELDNFAQSNASVQIQSVVAQDSTAANVLGSFNNASFVVNAGTSVRTGASGPSITLSLPATINYPITVDVQIDVNNGASTVSTLRYIINNPIVDNLNGSMNQRFSVSSKVNPADPGTINLPALPAAVLQARLVDITNGTVPVDNTSYGLFQLDALNAGYHIAIDNLDSNNVGDLNSNILGTDLNFSQHLGLNDLFVRTDDPAHWHDTRNSALYLDIRNDIKTDSNKLSHGKLTDVINFTTPSQLTYQYQTAAGDNSAVLDMLDLGKKNIFFAMAGGLPAHEASIANYAASIISFNANLTYSINLTAEQSKLMREALFDRVQGARGVDVNEEMANMIIFQQSFTASAKAIQSVRELMGILIDII